MVATDSFWEIQGIFLPNSSRAAERISRNMVATDSFWEIQAFLSQIAPVQQNEAVATRLRLIRSGKSRHFSQMAPVQQNESVAK